MEEKCHKETDANMAYLKDYVLYHIWIGFYNLKFERFSSQRFSNFLPHGSSTGAVQCMVGAPPTFWMTAGRAVTVLAG